MNEEEWRDYEDYVRYHMKLMVTPPMTREQYYRWQAHRNDEAIKRYWESYEERDNEVDSDNS